MKFRYMAAGKAATESVIELALVPVPAPALPYCNDCFTIIAMDAADIP